MVEIVFPGTPISRKSFRSFISNHRIKIIDPQSKELMQYKIIAISQIPEDHFIWAKDIPVYVCINCHFSIPKNWTKDAKSIAIKNYIPYIHAPDCDNIAKFFMDVIKGIVFEDDRQVETLTITKSYSTEPEVRIICKQTFGGIK